MAAVATPCVTAFQCRCVGSRHLDLNVAVFHLAAVSFQADWAGLGDGQGGFEQLAVAGAAGGPARHDDFDLKIGRSHV